MMAVSKPWYASRTIWGALIAFVAALVTTMGMDVAPGSEEVWTDIALQVATAVGSLFAIFGRLNADSVID